MTHPVIRLLSQELSTAPFLTKAISRKLEPDTMPALGRVSLLGEWPSTLLDYEGSVSVIRSSLRNTQITPDSPGAALGVHTLPAV